MPTEIDPTLYALFERIVREARNADAYHVMVTDARPDGSSYRYRRQLTASEKELIPWGVNDAIQKVEWFPNGEHGERLPNGRIGDGRSVQITCSDVFCGIQVRSSLYEPNYPLGSIGSPILSETAGVTRTVKSLANCVAYPDEDAVVRRVLEVIERAYKVIELEREEANADLDYEEDDVYDRLERQAYERLYGEPGGW